MRQSTYRVFDCREDSFPSESHTSPLNLLISPGVISLLEPSLQTSLTQPPNEQEKHAKVYFLLPRYANESNSGLYPEYNLTANIAWIYFNTFVSPNPLLWRP